MQDVLVPLADDLFMIVGPFRGKFPDAFSYLVTADPVTVIDTGFSEDIANWLIESFHPVRIVNTHSHIDHCRQNAAFAGCEVWVPRMGAETFGRVDVLAPRFCDEPAVAEAWARAIRDDLLFRECLPSHTFDDGHVFDFGRLKLRAIHTPGHLDDHFCFMDDAAGILMSVDIDLTKFGPWYGNVESDIDRFCRSVKIVRDLRPRMVTTAHRMPITEHIDEEFNAYEGRFDVNETRVLALLDRPHSMAELVEAKPFYRAHPHRKTLLRYFEKQMIDKHLRRLIADGRVRENDGIFERI